MEKTDNHNLLRLGLLAVAVALAVYVGFGFKWGISAPVSESLSVTWGLVLGILVGIAVSVVGFYLTMVHTKSVIFVNEVESELRKIIWPKSKPFAARTELWQSVLAVMLLMVVLVVYISIVDFIINLGIDAIL